MKYFATTIGILFLTTTSIFGQCLNSSCCLNGTIWDNSLGGCVVTLHGDFNGDLCITISDLLSLLSTFGTCLPVFNCGDSIDHDGYSYSTIQIGNQCWFSENCRYLPAVSDSYTGSETDPHYYVHGYEGSNVSDAVMHPNYSTYGVLYNHASAMAGDVCPTGWVVPSKFDFEELSNFLGGITVAGEHLKSQSGWTSNGNGTNSSGFTGVPGGYRTEYGGVFALEYKGLWWSSTISDTSPDKAHLRDLDYSWNNFQPQVYRFGNGYSVRCLMNTSSISGCTSSTACNFDPTANTYDGSCIEIGDTCDDNNPNTTGDIIQPDCSCLGTP